MKTNLLKEDVLTENSAGIGTVTRAMVWDRATELAVINVHPLTNDYIIWTGPYRVNLDRR